MFSHWLFVALNLCLNTVQAHPQPALGLPTVSMGSNPYQSFVGNASHSAEETLLVVPADQDFILTMVELNDGGVELRRDGVAVLFDPMIRSEYLGSGMARLRIPGGATISIRGPSSAAGAYYVQGFLTEQGGPNRYASGRTPGGGTHVVWTTDADRDFIVRTMLVFTSWCNFSLDGEPISYGAFPFAGGIQSGLEKGRGTFVLPKGSVLSLTHGMEGEACDYFMEGTYIHP